MGTAWESYDLERHLKARGRMIACWLIMALLWGGMWYQDWLVALFGMLANAFFVLSWVFFWQLYPEKSQRA